MSNPISEQLRFPTFAGMSVRVHFDGGAMSSDFGAILLAGVDHQIGLSERLADAFADMRHESYTTHVIVTFSNNVFISRPAAMRMATTLMISVLIPCSNWP